MTVAAHCRCGGLGCVHCVAAERQANDMDKKIVVHPKVAEMWIDTYGEPLPPDVLVAEVPGYQPRQEIFWPDDLIPGTYTLRRPE